MKTINEQKYVLQMMDISKIERDKNQPRKNVKVNIDELAESIKEKGILQPLLVREENDETILISGERRLEAALKAGLSQVPVIFYEGNPAELSLIENLQREDLHPIEEAEALQDLMKKSSYTQEEIGKLIGKKQSTISGILKLNEIHKSILTKCRNDKWWSQARLLRIAQKDTKQTQEEIFEEMLERKEKSGKRGKVNRVETIKKRVGLIVKSFSKIDTGQMNISEKNDLKKELIAMQEKVKTLLEKLE